MRAYEFVHRTGLVTYVQAETLDRANELFIWANCREIRVVDPQRPPRIVTEPDEPQWVGCDEHGDTLLCCVIDGTHFDSRLEV
tara:strand:- start:367 stop:615 length:249 start_codon:yes stop_codon:yes gene_type:complete